MSTRGMTLMEVMVVIGILSVVGMTLSGTIAYFYKSNAYLLEQTSSLDNARRGMNDAVRVIRQASYGDDGSFPMGYAATSTLTFYSDLDNDNSVEKVRYVLTGATLYREVTNSGGIPPSYAGQPQSTTTIASYVANSTSTPLFTYYDINGTQLSTTTTDEAQVASVGIMLMVDINPLRAPNVFTLSETTTLRNLRTD